MRHEVRVAPDRRGEVAVARAPQPGVAEVARRVVRLLERRAARARRTRAGRAPRAPRCARSRRPRRRPAAASSARAAAASGCRGSRAGRPGSSTDCGSGRSCTRYSVGSRRSAEVAGHLLVREDHQHLDHAVRLGLLLVAHAGDVAVGVELEGRLGGAELERRRARSRSAAATSRASRERLAPGLLGAAAPGEQLVDLAVGQPPVAADQRAVEATRVVTSAPSISISTVTASLSSPGPQRAGLGSRAPRAASARPRRARTRSCRAGSASRSSAPPGRTYARHVGDVHPDAHAAVLAPRRDRRRRSPCASSGSIVKVGQLASGPRARRPATGSRGRPPPRPRRAREAAAQTAVEHQPLDHVARAVRAAERAEDARAALPAAHQHEVADSGAAALHRRCAGRGAEERLGHEEAAALREHGDQRQVEPRAGRPRRRSSQLVEQRVERDRERLVALGLRVVLRLAPGLDALPW